MAGKRGKKLGKWSPERLAAWKVRRHPNGAKTNVQTPNSNDAVASAKEAVESN